jgi:VCBS repeat-containing protein
MPDSIWSSSTTPTTISASDRNSTALGVKFRSNTAGSITGIRFYKGRQNTGTHVGNLWSATGTNLATATFTNETASGWQQVNFAQPVSIVTGTTYVASYFAPNGRYSFNDNYFTAPVTNGALTALADGTDGPNGVRLYTATNAFPNGSDLKSNYWVDVVFEPSTTPAAGFNVVQTGSGTAVTEGGVTDTFTMALASAPTANVVVTINGTADVTGAPSTLTFTPANWQTAQTVTVTAVNDTDAEGQETSNLTFSTSSTDTRYNNFNVDPIAVTVTDTSTPPTNRNPVAANDSSTTNEDTPVTLSVLANDTDLDGDTLSIASLDLTGTKGAVTINPDNSIAYDPTAAFNALNTGETATDSFKYNVSDGKGGTASATVTVSVTGITDTTTNPIVAENSLTGNPQGEWDLTNGPSSNIEGFATDISVNKGGTVGFKVNTNASKYRLDIYRSGYYGGMGARKIATVRPTITQGNRVKPIKSFLRTAVTLWVMSPADLYFRRRVD